MKTIITLLAVVLLGFVVYSFATRPGSKSTTVQDISESVRSGATNIGESLKEKLDPERLKEELARTGKIVREKTAKAGEAIADAAANARTTAIIKSKLVRESQLASLAIDVDTTDGLVTLSGTVSTPEEIATAVRLALETEGVHKVVSTLQLKAP